VTIGAVVEDKNLRHRRSPDYCWLWICTSGRSEQPLSIYPLFRGDWHLLRCSDTRSAMPVTKCPGRPKIGGHRTARWACRGCPSHVIGGLTAAPSVFI